MMRFALILLLYLITLLPLGAQQTVGLFLNDPASFEGYTLFSPSAATTAYLIDNCGRQINSWHSNYINGGSVYLLEDSRLLRMATITNPFFARGGSCGRMEMFSWTDQLVWEYNYSNDTVHSHHDLEYLPNGNILVLAWESRTKAEAIALGRRVSSVDDVIWPEHIVEIKPIGSDDAEIVWEWHLWDHLIQDFSPTKANYGVVADHPERVDINYIGSGTSEVDWIHANAINYHAGLDQIIISARNFSEIWIIDHSTTTAEAASSSGGRWGKGGDLLYRWGNPHAYQRGSNEDQKFFSQHDAHWIPDDRPDGGRIMVFNNGVNRPGGSTSSVDILEPPVDAQGNYLLDTIKAFGPEEFVSSYHPAPPNSFYSLFISGAQQQANGNLLICIGIEGTFVEVDPLGQQVWKYVSPISRLPVTQGNSPSNNNVFRAYRYSPDYSAFDGRLLIPGNRLELEPLPLPPSCLPTAAISAETVIDLQVFPNPISDRLQLRYSGRSSHTLQIINTAGQRVWEGVLDSGNMEVNSQLWPAGLYILSVDQKYFHKIIKT